MQDTNLEALLGRIAEQQDELLRELKSQRRNGKDFWDRLTAISPIIAASIMACIGAYFTYSYNTQLVHVQEIQTVEKFIPHLAGDEKAKRAAILAISSMGNAPLAAKVAKIFASPGTASALRSIAATSDQQDKTIVNDALAKTLAALAEKYREEGKTAAIEEFRRNEPSKIEPTAVVQAASAPLERPTVEAVHLKQPEPRTDTNSSVEAEETENQHARPALAESTHSKQQ
jgi:hypothetical protein